MTSLSAKTQDIKPFELRFGPESKACMTVEV